VELWGWSDDAVRRTFRNEPGVVAIRHPERRGKRPYSKLSIPESVLVRVHERLSGKKEIVTLDRPILLWAGIYRPSNLFLVSS
jgi:hypothetical protein